MRSTRGKERISGTGGNIRERASKGEKGVWL